MKPIIKITNLSKQYRLGTVGTGTLRNDLQRWWYNVRGKEDPFLKIGETNVRSSKGDSEYVWALKDINFEVMPGEVLGIIGKNGAGKSTLLKILSRVTGPTTGRIDYAGRIGSLLEVGTGFHPELTGRENIFLNGAILGMTKAEIRGKLDEIIDFSGVERYIDTPVKRYSSGMMVRLGFAVAAHLEPEILVVDEVLAVGDAEFQKKAIGKMQDVSRNDGRTVLFVSHNMGAVRNLCTQGFLLCDGSFCFEGDVNDTVDFYISNNKLEEVVLEKVIDDSMRLKGLTRDVEFKKIGFTALKTNFTTSEKIDFDVIVRANKNTDSFRLNCTISTLDDNPVGSVSGTVFFNAEINEIKKLRLTLVNHNLSFGEYYISFSLGTGNFLTGQTDFDLVLNILQFKIDRYDSSNRSSFAQWNKTWGCISFQSKTQEL